MFWNLKEVERLEHDYSIHAWNNVIGDDHVAVHTRNFRVSEFSLTTYRRLNE